MGTESFVVHDRRGIFFTSHVSNGDEVESGGIIPMRLW
jgi:hypothetical protein